MNFKYQLLLENLQEDDIKLTDVNRSEGFDLTVGKHKIKYLFDVTRDLKDNELKKEIKIATKRIQYFFDNKDKIFNIIKKQLVSFKRIFMYDKVTESHKWDSKEEKIIKDIISKEISRDIFDLYFYNKIENIVVQFEVPKQYYNILVDDFIYVYYNPKINRIINITTNRIDWYDRHYEDALTQEEYKKL